MPTVPNLEAPQVQQEPLPGRAFPRVDDNVSPASFGAPLAQGLEAVGQAATDEETKLRRQNDQLRVIDANTQLEAAKTQMLYGQVQPDGTRSGGAYSLHGLNAINMPATILPHYDEAAGKISATLTPDQQRLFQGHVLLGKGELNTSLSRYEFEESNRLSNTVYDNAVKQTVTNAALGWRDPDAVTKARLDLRGLVQMQGDREGWDPGTRSQVLLAALGDMHKGVVESMVDQGNLSGARTYLFNAMAQKEMDPKAADGTLRMVNAQEEHKLAMDDKQQRDASNGLLKNAILMQQKGQLTPQWIEQHHATWEPQAYEYAYKLLAGKESTTDPRTFAPLLQKALSGQDVSEEAQQALYAGKLTLTDYKSVAEKSEAPRKGYVTRGADYINQALQTNPMIPDPGGRRSLANALDDWRQWTEEHPQATATEARNTYRSITDHYQVVGADKAAVFMQVPLHLVGSRMQPDIMATATATKKAHDAGEMSDEEYRRQSALVMQWQDIMQRKAPPKAATP